MKTIFLLWLISFSMMGCDEVKTSDNTKKGRGNSADSIQESAKPEEKKLSPWEDPNVPKYLTCWRDADDMIECMDVPFAPAPECEKREQEGGVDHYMCPGKCPYLSSSSSP